MAVSQARDLLCCARRTRAQESIPGCGPDYDKAAELVRGKLSQHADLLRAHTQVVGTAVGPKIEKGVPGRVLVATIFVSKKLLPEELGASQLPSHIGVNGPQTDVVELGEFELLVRLGASLGNNTPNAGTLGAVAFDPEYGDVGITAMHVSEGRDMYFPSPQKSSNSVLFGSFIRGSKDRTDAASFKLKQKVDAQYPIIGDLFGWRPVAVPGDTHSKIRMYGATSGYQEGTILYPDADLSATYLGRGILARIHTNFGDSGAACIDDDGCILGFLVGRYRASDNFSYAVFTPADVVFATLGCNL